MRKKLATACLAAALLAACSSGGPPPPAWQLDAKSAADAATAAYLAGESRAEAAALARARSAVSATGRAELAARLELMHCAARVASLVFDACERFEALRADAPPAERAYADYLAGKGVSRDDVPRLPAAQQAVARGDATLAGLQALDDPLARLIAVAVLLQSGKAHPAMIELATETASAQGWRRPLLGWLKVQALRAEKAGDAAALQSLQRRIALVEGRL